MFKIIGTIFLFLTLVTLTAIKPVYIPIEWLDILKDFAPLTLYFEGFLPVQMFFDTILFTGLVLLYIILFRFLMGVISMFTGGGKPEI